MERQEGGKQGSERAAAALLKFHFPTSPSRDHQRQSSSGTNQQRGHRRQKKNPQQYHRTKEDRASARKKPSSAMFYLHSSPDHAFVITRRPTKTQQYSFNGSDCAVSWASVRIVKYLSTVQQQESCPICLDSFSSARITKCGHCFCLSCLIHHVQSFAANNPYATDGPKCPCCAISLHLEDVRPVQLVTVVPPATNRQIKLFKLHRSRACPCPFLPTLNQPRHSSPHSAPCQSDKDAPFCRFNYVDPALYHRHLMENQQELERLQVENDIEGLCRSLAMDTVKKELAQAVEEASEEQVLMERFAGPAAGIYQEQPKHLMAHNYQPALAQQKESETTSPLEADGSESTEVGLGDYSVASCSEHPDSPKADYSPRQRKRGDSLHSEHHPDSPKADYSPGQKKRGDSLCSEPSFQSCESYRRARGDSMTSHDSSTSRSTYSRRGGRVEGTMYLDQDECAFYQAEDGSLCFLSGFNMKCLQAEYSATVPDESLLMLDVTPRRRVAPLPDVVQGRILEIERVQLTPDLRQRLRFLSHLPLYTDICFVEIGLGNFLSRETKKQFQKEFAKRKQARANRINADKRADERERRKEEARINEMKARMQRIDPNDDFFQPAAEPEPDLTFTGESFGPSVVSVDNSAHSVDHREVQSPSSPDPAVSFSQICRAGKLDPTRETEFPALGSSPPTRTSVPPPSWIKMSKTKEVQEQHDAPASPPTGKKKSKGKKIVLFSTGGHRGSS